MEESMSVNLFEAMFEPFCYVEKTRVPDGEGGTTVTWHDGAEFHAHAAFDSSIEARRGAVAGVSSLYTITAPTSTHLEYHDVVKRLRDNKIFRVTSDGDDIVTPDQATFSFLKVTAEEWVLAGGTT
jgi:hypothetical protein